MPCDWGSFWVFFFWASPVDKSYFFYERERERERESLQNVTKIGTPHNDQPFIPIYLPTISRASISRRRARAAADPRCSARFEGSGTHPGSSSHRCEGRPNLGEGQVDPLVFLEERAHQGPMWTRCFLNYFRDSIFFTHFIHFIHLIQASISWGSLLDCYCGALGTAKSMEIDMGGPKIGLTPKHPSH